MITVDLRRETVAVVQPPRVEVRADVAGPAVRVVSAAPLGGYGPPVTEHAGLTGRDAPDSHPIGAVTGLAEALAGAAPLPEVWVGAGAPTGAEVLWVDTDAVPPAYTTDTEVAAAITANGPPILVLGKTDPVPGGTAAGTVIVRREA